MAVVTRCSCSLSLHPKLVACTLLAHCRVISTPAFAELCIHSIFLCWAAQGVHAGSRAYIITGGQRYCIPPSALCLQQSHDM